eukprot:SAG31_NODE_298_length_18125_cov_27.373350_5_plen_240_part_00
MNPHAITAEKMQADQTRQSGSLAGATEHQELPDSHAAFPSKDSSIVEDAAAQRPPRLAQNSSFLSNQTQPPSRRGASPDASESILTAGAPEGEESAENIKPKSTSEFITNLLRKREEGAITDLLRKRQAGDKQRLADHKQQLQDHKQRLAAMREQRKREREAQGIQRNAIQKNKPAIRRDISTASQQQKRPLQKEMTSAKNAGVNKPTRPKKKATQSASKKIDSNENDTRVPIRVSAWL